MPDSLPWDQISNQQPLKARNQTPVVIVGAGLAGCWMARTLAESSIKVVVLEAGESIACAASSNPIGMFKPYVTRSDSHAMQFYVQAHHCLLQRLQQWQLLDRCDYSACGVLQLVERLYPDSAHYKNLRTCDIEQSPGHKLNANALLFEKAGWLNPNALCKALLEHTNIQVRCRHEVVDMQADVQTSGTTLWRVVLGEKSDLLTEHLILSAGVSTARFGITRALPAIPARGQISRFQLLEGVNNIKQVINARSYIIPDGDTVVVGATFERDADDASVKKSDDAINLAGLQETVLSLQVHKEAIDAYAGVRATTPDRLPMIGPVPDSILCASIYGDIHHGRKLHNYPPLPVKKGLYVLAGLGSRGIVTAPFAANLLTDFLLGGSALEPWIPLVNPARFQIRQLKRAETKR